MSTNYLRIAEGHSATYTVRLPSQPSGDVTVELLVWRLGAVRVEPHQMRFTRSNWNVPRTATVLTASDDDSQDIWTVILHTRSDASLTRAAAIVRVIVDDQNEPLRVSGNSTPEYAENATTTVAAYATPWTSSVAWSLFGADSDHFSINNDGHLSFAAAPDYEHPADADADNVYQVGVHASDGSSTGSRAVSVTVTDLNEPPDVFGPVGVGVEESSGTSVGAYSLRRPGRGPPRAGRLRGATASTSPSRTVSCTSGRRPTSRARPMRTGTTATRSLSSPRMEATSPGGAA